MKNSKNPRKKNMWVDFFSEKPWFFPNLDRALIGTYIPAANYSESFPQFRNEK